MEERKGARMTACQRLVWRSRVDTPRCSRLLNYSASSKRPTKLRTARNGQHIWHCKDAVQCLNEY